MSFTLPNPYPKMSSEILDSLSQTSETGLGQEKVKVKSMQSPLTNEALHYFYPATFS
jgi:hypothetical protein